jgi:hypothetical protein
MVLLVLKLFVSSHPLNYEGVLCIYVLLFHEGQAEYHFAMFSLCSKQQLTFDALLFMIFCLYSFHVVTWLLRELYLLCLCLEYFDLSLQCFTITWSRLCWLHVISKIIFVITYLLEDEHELILGMLIRCKRIYNFWCSMLVLHQLLYVLFTLCSIFLHFLELTY